MKDIIRCVSTGFWNDDKVLNDFSPEDKYFMLYLLTNPYTTQLGVYHLPIKKAALETGYSVDAIKVLLDRFEHKYKIIRFNHETSEVAIKNYLKHSIIRGGKPVKDCLEKDLKGVKDVSLVGFVFNHMSDLDTLNETVTEFIYIHSDIKDKYNDNDNDNERIVDDSYHDSSRMPKTSQKPKIVYFENNEELDRTFHDYLDMRKKIKKPATDRAIELAIKKLDKLSNGDDDIKIEIINQSIMNCWQDLYELKGKKTTTQRDLLQELRDA